MISNFCLGDASESAEDAFVRRAKEGMGGDEAQFSVELPLTGKMYLWADKYRPRKPRFFNRVHTGFEWNKYNQTHYDFDNPPPKIVQGYKFNIFYPDLIDKRSTPQYFLTSHLKSSIGSGSIPIDTASAASLLMGSSSCGSTLSVIVTGDKDQELWLNIT
ncbi:cactin-like isoform X1 [Astyanax mexicanus]|uniref:Cactin-like isoform X1 n=1 Tax=Astyanax mexicanus TaxID=7994 RepID=A0A8T2M560_ASTMX|nr:cactin-like isoform X1 [Astyanax mexicanus]